MPAYVIFHDATLREIATRRPTSLAELGGSAASARPSWRATARPCWTPSPNSSCRTARAARSAPAAACGTEHAPCRSMPWPIDPVTRGAQREGRRRPSPRDPGPHSLRRQSLSESRLTVGETRDSPSQGDSVSGSGDSPSRKRGLAVTGMATRRHGNDDSPCGKADVGSGADAARPSGRRAAPGATSAPTELPSTATATRLPGSHRSTGR